LFSDSYNERLPQYRTLAVGSVHFHACRSRAEVKALQQQAAANAEALLCATNSERDLEALMLRVATLSSELAAEAQAKAAAQQQHTAVAAECAALREQLAAAQQKSEQAASDAATVQIDLHKSRAQQRWVRNLTPI
jgi:hypothetical protein